MSFFDDEGDEPRTAIRTTRPAPRRPAGGGRHGPDDRTLLIRRGGAAVVAILIVVLVVLGVKAILDRQATDALKTYAANVDSLVGSEQASVRVPFFQQLDLAYNSSNQSAVANNIQIELQQEQANYRNAQAWSVPSQMVAAQREFVLALGLRVEALKGVENEIAAALGTGDQATAIKAIAGDMQLLLTSDVLYSQRVQPLIAQALADAGIAGQSVSPSQFLPDVGWLVPRTAANLILGYVPTSLGGVPPTGSNGHQLVGVTYNNNVALAALPALNRIPLGAQGVTFVLDVKNTGTGTVHDVITKVRFSSRSVSRTALSCLATVSSIAVTTPGTSYNSPIVVSPPAACSGFYGVPLNMTAEVVPVPGETDVTNNFMRFLVEFTH